MADKRKTTTDVPREAPAADVYAGALDIATLEHEYLNAGTDPVAVILPRERAEGVVRVGDMVPDRVYLVPIPEARRLVAVKGFLYATQDAAERAAAWPSEPAAVAPGPSEGGGPLDDARRRAGTTDTRDED